MLEFNADGSKSHVRLKITLDSAEKPPAIVPTSIADQSQAEKFMKRGVYYLKMLCLRGIACCFGIEKMPNLIRRCSAAAGLGVDVPVSTAGTIDMSNLPACRPWPDRIVFRYWIPRKSALDPCRGCRCDALR